MPVEEELQYDLLTSNSAYYMKELCNIIKNFGLENYKNICYKFNYTLELLAKEGIEWTISDEGILSDSINFDFVRDFKGNLSDPYHLLKVYEYGCDENKMNIIE